VHRYEELERLYYKKLFLKIFLGIFLFIVIVVSLFFLLTFSKENKKETVKKQKVVKSKESKKEKNDTKKIEKKVFVKKTQNKIEPLNFIVPDIEEKKESKPVKTENQNEKKPLKVKKEVKKRYPIIKEVPVIQEKEVKIDDLIKSYKLNPNYDLALMIAKKFYKKNNLKSAQIWVIKANNLDPSRVESWLLFADILLKEHKKQKALEVLKIYLDQYGDNEAVSAKIRSINE